MVEFKAPTSSTEGGVLASLWRKVLYESGAIKIANMLVSRYTNETNKDDMAAVKRKTKSTLIANIVSSDMTFKVFLDLVFNYLNAKRITLTVTITHGNSRETMHSITVDNANTPEGEEDGDRKDNLVSAKSGDEKVDGQEKTKRATRKSD